jgi:hypothetical protein
MRIDSSNELEGVALPEIRAAFRELGLDGIISTDFIRQRFRLSKPRAERLIAALQGLRLVKPIPTRRPRHRATGEWLLTDQGIRLRAATAASPIRRTTADRLLSDLLDRIEILNGDDRFLGRVQKAVVFGSYIGNAEHIGDIDVAVEIVRREPDFDKHTQANNRRVAEGLAAGRRFSNILEQAFWWQKEAFLFLRNRKRGLSLQDYGPIKDIVAASPHRLVFEDPGRLPGRGGPIPAQKAGKT